MAPDSWASRAEDVPARCDQPGRSGPTSAKTAMTPTTAAVPMRSPHPPGHRARSSDRKPPHDRGDDRADAHDEHQGRAR